MTKPVEFSRFYRLLNAAKEGEAGKKEEVDLLLKEYEASQNSESALHQLGETFLYVGVGEVYKYTEIESIEVIGLLEKEQWEEIAEKRRADVAPHLANTMIKFARKNNLSKKISTKWGISKREVEQNIMQMARYITEGILDALD